jgi:hypothetical protein
MQIYNFKKNKYKAVALKYKKSGLIKYNLIIFF